MDHIVIRKATPGTHRSNRWTNRVFVINTRGDWISGKARKQMILTGATMKELAVTDVLTGSLPLSSLGPDFELVDQATEDRIVQHP